MSNDINDLNQDVSPDRILSDYYNLPFAYRCNYENALIIREQFLYLHEKSTYQQESLMENLYAVNYDRFAEYIFLVCAEMNLSHECKYIAYELFKKFICNHIISLLKALKEQTKEQPAEIKEYWDYINGKLKEQLLLRILSCVQIASKMNNRNECISNGALYSFMLKANTPFTIDAIAKSELRIFSTVGFKPLKRDNLFAYYELHVLAIEKDFDGNIDVDSFYNLGLKILDIVQINWTVILKSFAACLQELHSGETKPNMELNSFTNEFNLKQLIGLEQNTFRKIITKDIRNNYLFISCGVIAATVYILHKKSTKKIVQILAGHVGIDARIVAIAATYIIMFINTGA